MKLKHLATRGVNIHVFEIEKNQTSEKLFALINTEQMTIELSEFADQFYKFGYFTNPIHLTEIEYRKIVEIVENEII